MKSPGHEQHPEHRVTQTRLPQRMRARLGADVLAESDDVIAVDEDGHPRRHYFPRADVRAQYEPTETRTHCPFKGDASYYALRLGDGLVPDVAWSYDRPYDEHAELAGRLAFWDERIADLRIEPA